MKPNQNKEMKPNPNCIKCHGYGSYFKHDALGYEVVECKICFPKHGSFRMWFMFWFVVSIVLAKLMFWICVM